MILNDKEILHLIRSKNLITDCDQEKIVKCSYILHIGKFFEPETGDMIEFGHNKWFRKRIYTLKPSEVLIVMTKEKIQMPSDLCATYSPLNRLAQRGLMLINASIIEPGYDGFLSCFIVNFSKETVRLKEGDEIAKILFHRINYNSDEWKSKPISNEKYANTLAEMASKFDKTFLDIGTISKKAEKKAVTTVKRNFVLGTIFIAFLLIWATLEPVLSKWAWKNHDVIRDEKTIEAVKLSNEIKSAKNEVLELKQELQTKLKIDSLVKRIEYLEQKFSNE